MVLNGLGGTGKTIISWEWKEQLKQKGNIPKPLKIFLWSFYKVYANFENFLNVLLTDDYGKNTDIVRSWSTDQKVDELLNLLNQQNTLLVLDGIEKELLAYKDTKDEHYDQTNIIGNRELRQYTNRTFKKFVNGLNILPNCKTLITTRVMPEGFPDLDDPGYSYDISGCEVVTVEDMEDTEVIAFVRSFDIKGTDHEILAVANEWSKHPLSLRLLVNYLDYRRKEDSKYIPHIKDAPPIDELETDRLKRTLKAIAEHTPEREKLLLMQMSAFRLYSMNYPMLIIFRQDESIPEFKQVMQNLYDLGLITSTVNEKYEISDDTDVNIHPLIRHFFYIELRESVYLIETHELLIEFFKTFIDNKNKYDTIFGKMYQAIKAAEGYETNTLNDLIPVIELYHHLVGAGKLDEACDLLDKRLIPRPLHYQFAEYNLMIELLQALFPDGEDKLPRLKKEVDQAWTLTSLANIYTPTGQPTKSFLLFLLALKILEKCDEKLDLASGMINMACMTQSQIGKLTAGASHLRKGIALCQEMEDEFREAAGHQELGKILAYQCKFSLSRRTIDNFDAEELARAFELFEKDHHIQSLSVVSTYLSLSALLSARLTCSMPKIVKNSQELSLIALQLACKALEFTEKTVKMRIPVPRDFIRAYWMLGESLLQCLISSKSFSIETLEIRFYDEHFQKVTETFELKQGNELETADRCLDEALRRCRKVNLVELEPEILLSRARLMWVKMGRSFKDMGDIEEILNEAHGVAERASYRLNLADIHLFCGEVLLETPDEKLLGLKAEEHLKLAKEYALDQSTFDDLYKPLDPHFYDGIPEYEMLKRGMTDQERIENGYYVAYQIAEALEKKLK